MDEKPEEEVSGEKNDTDIYYDIIMWFGNKLRWKRKRSSSPSAEGLPRPTLLSLVCQTFLLGMSACSPFLAPAPMYAPNFAPQKDTKNCSHQELATFLIYFCNQLNTPQRSYLCGRPWSWSGPAGRVPPHVRPLQDWEPWVWLFNIPSKLGLPLKSSDWT